MLQAFRGRTLTLAHPDDPNIQKYGRFSGRLWLYELDRESKMRLLKTYSHTSHDLAMEPGKLEERQLEETQTLQQGKPHARHAVPMLHTPALFSAACLAFSLAAQSMAQPPAPRPRASVPKCPPLRSRSATCFPCSLWLCFHIHAYRLVFLHYCAYLSRPLRVRDRLLSTCRKDILYFGRPLLFALPTGL